MQNLHVFFYLFFFYSREEERERDSVGRSVVSTERKKKMKIGKIVGSS